MVFLKDIVNQSCKYNNYIGSCNYMHVRAGADIQGVDEMSV